MTFKFKQSPNFVGGTNRIRFPITGNGRIRNVGSSLIGSRLAIDSNHLLVYYFDESGTTVTNLGSVAGNNLTLSGTDYTRNYTSLYTKGTKATYFDGTIGGATNGSPSGVTLSTSPGYTVEAVCSWNSSWTGDESTLIQLWGPSLVLGWRRLSSTNFEIATFGAAFNTTSLSSAGLTHIAATISGNTLTIYLNGVQTGQSTSFTSASLGSLTKINVATQDAATTRDWSGAIGEVRISNVVRDVTYMQQAYQAALNL